MKQEIRLLTIQLYVLAFECDSGKGVAPARIEDPTGAQIAASSAALAACTCRASSGRLSAEAWRRTCDAILTEWLIEFPCTRVLLHCTDRFKRSIGALVCWWYDTRIVVVRMPIRRASARFSLPNCKI